MIQHNMSVPSILIYGVNCYIIPEISFIDIGKLISKFAQKTSPRISQQKSIKQNEV